MSIPASTRVMFSPGTETEESRGSSSSWASSEQFEPFLLYSLAVFLLIQLMTGSKVSTAQVLERRRLRTAFAVSPGTARPQKRQPGLGSMGLGTSPSMGMRWWVFS